MLGEREVEGDRADGDDAEEELLDMRPGREQRQALLQLGEEQRAAHGADDGALAAGKAGAADDHRGEHREGVGAGRCSAATVWMKEKSRMPAIAASIAAEHEGEDLVARHRQAGEPRRDRDCRRSPCRRKPNSERCRSQPTITARTEHPHHLERDRMRAEAGGQAGEEVELGLRDRRRRAADRPD